MLTTGRFVRWGMRDPEPTGEVGRKANTGD
jgi:hypothetical protein